MMGALLLSSPALGFSGSLGASTLTSTLWWPFEVSFLSRSKTNPWSSQTLAATSGSIVWLMFAKICKDIRSLIRWNGLSPRCSASSLTMIGALRCRIFLSASGSTGDSSAARGAGVSGVAGAGGSAALATGGRMPAAPRGTTNGFSEGLWAPSTLLTFFFGSSRSTVAITGLGAGAETSGAAASGAWDLGVTEEARLGFAALSSLGFFVTFSAIN